MVALADPENAVQTAAQMKARFFFAEISMAAPKGGAPAGHR
jgi:hypothetical protein